MSNFDNAAAALKASAGLPTNVNPPAAPLPVGGVPTNAPVQAAPPLQKSAEELLALKDQTIADKDARIVALEAANEQGLASVMQMIEAKITPPQAPQPVELPPLPANLDELPAKEQIELIANRKVDEKLGAAIAAEREAMMKALGPVLMRTKQAAEETDRLAVERKYPQFDYTKLKPEMDKLGTELPGSMPIERAALAAQRTGNEAMLLPPIPQAPMSQPAIPSMSTAAGMTGAPPQQQQGPDEHSLLIQAGQLKTARRGVEGNAIIDAVLKKRLFPQR